MSLQEILMLLNKQMTDGKIAEAIGTKQSVVWRLRNGKHKTTSFERGQAILSLARKKGIDV